MKLTQSLIASFCLLFASGIAAESGSLPQGPQYRIIVFKQTATPFNTHRAIVSSNIAAMGGHVTHELHLINAVSVLIPTGSVDSFQSKSATDPEIERIDEDHRVNWLSIDAPSLQQIPFGEIHAPAMPRLTHPAPPSYDNAPWGIRYVHAPEAWHKTQGRGVRVGVIDTGIDYDHPLLKAKIKGGWNGIADAPNAADFKDDNGHGTHVSGIIAADYNPSNGVVGVAPKATLYGIKVLDAGGGGTFADVVAGIQWAVDNKLDVVNMSLGADEDDESLKDAVRAAARADLTIIAAAGNTGAAVIYPAAYPEVIAISAMDRDYHLAVFSSRGPQVAFTAPGVDIFSTYLNGYQTLSGTSMACPHAVGLVALDMSIRHVHGSQLVRRDLDSAAVVVPSVGTSDDQGAGLIDARKIVDSRH